VCDGRLLEKFDGADAVGRMSTDIRQLLSKLLPRKITDKPTTTGNRQLAVTRSVLAGVHIFRYTLASNSVAESTLEGFRRCLVVRTSVFCWRTFPDLCLDYD